MDLRRNALTSGDKKTKHKSGMRCVGFEPTPELWQHGTISLDHNALHAPT
jgi:hypothetical protein